MTTLKEIFANAIQQYEIIRKGESLYNAHYVFLVKINEGVEYYYQVFVTDVTGDHILQTADCYDTEKEAYREYRAHLKREQEQPLSQI